MAGSKLPGLNDSAPGGPFSEAILCCIGDDSVAPIALRTNKALGPHRRSPDMICFGRVRVRHYHDELLAAAAIVQPGQGLENGHLDSDRTCEHSLIPWGAPSSD